MREKYSPSRKMYFFFLLLNGSAPIRCDWDAKSYRKTQGRYAVKSNNRLVTWMSKWRKVESGASQSNKRVSNVTLSPGSTKHPTSQHEPQSRPFRGPSVRGSIINCHTKMWCLDEFDPNLTLSVKRYENGRVKKKMFCWSFVAYVHYHPWCSKSCNLFKGEFLNSMMRFGVHVSRTFLFNTSGNRKFQYQRVLVRYLSSGWDLRVLRPTASQGCLNDNEDSAVSLFLCLLFFIYAFIFEEDFQKDSAQLRWSSDMLKRNLVGRWLNGREHEGHSMVAFSGIESLGIQWSGVNNGSLYTGRMLYLKTSILYRPVRQWLAGARYQNE